MEDQIEREGEYISARIWDIPTRVLHWLNALAVISLALFALAMWKVEGMGLPDEASELLMGLLRKTHTYIGYFLVISYSLRMVWGVAGNRYARFSDMISLKKGHWEHILGNIRWYLSGFRGTPPFAAGHNPLASLFYIPLFFVLASQAVSGIILAGLEYEVFPGTVIMERYGLEGVDLWGSIAERVHVYGLYFIMAFFCAHMVGLIVHEVGEKGSLLSSMLHGRKFFRKDELK